MDHLSGHMKQKEFGKLVGITQQTTSDLIKRGILKQGATAGEWLLAYCANLREVAAGRMSADGALDLVAERARLARAQSVRVEMANATAQRVLVPVHVISEVLSRVGRQIAVILESIPVNLKRRSSIRGDDLDFIRHELARARNLAALIEIDLSDLADDGAAAGQGDEAPKAGHD